MTIRCYLFIFVSYFLIRVILIDSAFADIYHSNLMDGVKIDAVESYLSPKDHELEVGTSVYAFDPYYTGISVNLGYVQNFSPKFSWQIIDVDYFFSYQSNLTSQLASNYAVNPQTIERLSYMVSTNFKFYYFYGKFIFFNNSIKYLRGSFILGGGLLGTSLQNQGAGNFGTAFDILVSDVFSFKIVIRDTISIPKFNNFITFGLETGLNF